MKQQFIARKDINRRAGDVLITASAGETLALSDRESAIAASFDELEYVGAAAETPLEEQFVAAQTVDTYESLMKLRRDELAEKAAALDIPVNSDTKDEIAKAILAKRSEDNLHTASPDFANTPNNIGTPNNTGTTDTSTTEVTA